MSLRSGDISRLKLKDRIIASADIVISVELGDIFWADFSQFDECVTRGRIAAENALPEIQARLKLASEKALDKSIDLMPLKLHVIEE
mgnify:CR=1 FL=1